MLAQFRRFHSIGARHRGSMMYAPPVHLPDVSKRHANWRNVALLSTLCSLLHQGLRKFVLHLFTYVKSVLAARW
jgi:hypothetical protein